MKIQEVILRDLDLFITLVIFVYLLLAKFYFEIEYSYVIGSDIFLQVYTAIVAVVLTVFAIITSFNEKLFVNITKQKVYRIFKRSFYTPLIASIAGIIYTILTSFKFSVILLEMEYIVNMSILAYAILSSLILFNFLFKLTFALKKELYKNS